MFFSRTKSYEVIFLAPFYNTIFFFWCQHDNEERIKRLRRRKTDTERWKLRVERKKNHAEEQELRLVITVSLITIVKAKK